MKIPYKQMFSWKAGTLGPTLIGLSYILLPLLAIFMAGGSGTLTVDPRLMTFGFTFLLVGLIMAKTKPTILGCLFTMLLGLSYFLGFMVGMGATTTFWTISIVLTVLTLAFELDIFKFGPSNAKAKALLVAPLAIIGFSLLLAIVGYNPMIAFSWSNWLVALDYVAVMLFCWIYVFQAAGWRPLGARTLMWMNLMAIAVVALTVLSVLQGLAIIAP